MTYQWRKNGASISGATSSTYTIAHAQTNDAAVYSVKIVNAGGFVISSGATLTVLVPPTITTQPQNQTATLGQSATFSVVASGTAPLSYQWKLSGLALSGATNAALTLTNVQVTNASGSYSVTVSNVAGAVSSTNATLTVLVPPTITTQPQSQTVTLVPGQSVTFGVVASGTTPLSYRWRFNGTALAGATNAVLQLTNLQATNAGSYTVVVTNVAGSVTSAVATLAFNIPPTITAQPQSQTATQGLNATFSVAASGTAPLSYQWSFNGLARSGATNSALALTSVQTNDAGNYSVRVTNLYGSIISSNATLTVYTPPVITSQPQSQGVPQHGTVSFSVVASSTSPITYQWYLNGTKMGAGSTGSTLTVANAGTGDAGNYTAVLVNSGGSVTSAVATLVVYAPPTITTQPADQTVLQGQTATFSVTATAGGTTPSPVVFDRASSNNISGNLTWSHVTTTAANRLLLVGVSYGDLGLTNSSPITAITYGGLSLTKVLGSTNTYFFLASRYCVSEVWQLVNPPSGTNGVALTQAGSSTSLIAGAATFSGVDQTTPLSAVSSDMASPLFSATASVTLSSATNEIVFDNVAYQNTGTASPGPGQSLCWNLGADQGGGASTKPGTNWVSMSWTVPLSYWVQVAVSVKPALLSGAATWTMPCYQWNFSGTNLPGATNASLTITNAQASDAGNVFVVITNYGGSVTSQVKMLTVNVPATITNQPQPQAVLAGQNAMFSVGAQGTPNLSYQWYLNGVSLGGAGTGPTLALSSVGKNEAGNYSVVVKNNSGSVTSLVASLTVLITQPVNQTVGVGGNASFSVGVSSPATLSYQWTDNGTDISGATNATLTLTDVPLTAGGSYAVAITTPGGILTSSAATLTVLDGWVGVVTNTSDSGLGSLRQAVLGANASTIGPRFIAFSIPGAGPFTINVGLPLPVITNPVTIDGTTQPGFVNRPVVEINGNNGTGAGDGLCVQAGGCIIKGLAVNQFSGCGIVLALGSSNLIQGNFIGTGLDGVTKLANSSHGLMISNSAWNIVGGPDGLTRNIVMGSGEDGIHLEGTGASNNQIIGNIVGLDWTGLIAGGVEGSGIVVANAASNVIGGTNAGAGNISSQHSGDGLVISGSNACFNLVQGNSIGTDSTGTNALGNNGNGITLWNAPSNTVGGLTLAAANVIVDNAGHGIALTGSAAQFNVVQGNFIGTDRSGALDLHNSKAGVRSLTVLNNLVGGLAPGSGNTIAFNRNGGVVVNGGQCAILGNSLYSNRGAEISLVNGGNSHEPSPVLTGVTNNLFATQFQGTLNNTPETTFRVEFFASPTAAGDAQTFLGAASVTTDDTGAGLVNTILTTGNITNQFVTATATDPDGNTSQLSGAEAVTFAAAPLIASAPSSQTVTQGMNVTLSVVLAGTPPYSYQWQLSERNILGATNSTLALTNIQLNQAGSYQVRLADQVGSATTPPAFLTVVLPTTANLPAMQGLVVHLTFDADLTDSSGRGNHAAPAGAPNFVPGFIGASAFNPFTDTNGVNNYATFGTPSDLSFGSTNDFSIAFWARLPAGAWSGSSSFEPPFICNKNFSSYANVGWALATGPGGRLEWNYTEASPNTPHSYFGSGGVFGHPIWHHVAVTFQRAGRAIAYIDGVSVSTNSIAPGGQSIDPGLPTNLGNDGTGSFPAAYGYFTNGFGIPTNGLAMDDLGIWRRALSAPEIGAIYNVGLAGQDLSTVTSNDVAATLLPQITQQPASRKAIAGGPASLFVTASSPSPFACQWFGNGLPIAGATDALLALTNVQSPQAGGYFVVITNAVGSVTSAVATLELIAVPPGSYLEAVVTNSPVAFWRLGEPSGTTAFDYLGGNDARYTNVTLNQPGALATDSDTAAGFNGTSSYAGTGVSLANNRAAFTLEGWYKLKAGAVRMGFWGQNNAIEFGLNSPTNLQIWTAGGGSLTVTNIWGTNSWHHLAAVGNGTDLRLYVDGNLAGTRGVATTNYGASTYPFNLGGGGIFDSTTNWFNGCLDEVAFYDRALADTDIKRHYLLGLEPPTITLTAPTNNAMFTPPATINLAAAVATNGHSITSVQFFNGPSLLNEVLAAPYAFTWNDVGDGTHNLSAVVLYDVGSVTSAVVTVTVLTPLSILTQPLSQTVAAGQSASFSVAATGAAPLSYQWCLNGTNLAGATSSTLALTNVQMTDAGDYTVVVTNVAGSVTSVVAMLTVTNPLPPSLDAPVMASTGFSFQFSVPVGFTYVIWISTNLQDWTPLATNVALTSSVVFTDPAATNCSQRFYRATAR
jgi:hypothetical protein